MNSVMQVSAINRNLDLKALVLLNYIRDHFFMEKIVGSKLQLSNPLVFTSSADVKSAFERLVDEGFLFGVYNRGVISSMELNFESFKDFYSAEDVVIKREKKSFVKKKEISGEEVEIVDHYNKYPELPRPSTLTPTNRVIIKSKLDLYSLDEIKDAITFADEVNWIKSKLEEPWLNLTWIIRNIENFMPDGKYRNIRQVKEPAYVSSNTEEVDLF